MVMSSKVWDDLSMWNADFSQVCSSFTLQRINELELAMLNALRYDVKVKASEYAKYYFLLRSMLMKSGLGGDHVESLQPLDIEGAKQIEIFSEEYEIAATSDTLKRRAGERRGEERRGEERRGEGTYSRLRVVPRLGNRCMLNSNTKSNTRARTSHLSLHERLRRG
jgi:hypothetical protein